MDRQRNLTIRMGVLNLIWSKHKWLWSQNVSCPDFLQPSQRIRLRFRTRKWWWQRTSLKFQLVERKWTLASVNIKGKVRTKWPRHGQLLPFLILKRASIKEKEAYKYMIKSSFHRHQWLMPGMLYHEHLLICRRETQNRCMTQNTERRCNHWKNRIQSEAEALVFTAIPHHSMTNLRMPSWHL